MTGRSFLKRVFSRPIAFHPVLARITGSVNAGLMLSQAIYWSDVTESGDPEREGWFYKTQEEWTAETCLSRYEQETARRALKRLGLMFDDRRGLNPTLWFRVDLERVFALCNQSDAGKPHQVMGETSSTESGKPPSGGDGKPPQVKVETTNAYKEAETTKQRLLTESGPLEISEISSEISTVTPPKEKARAVAIDSTSTNQGRGGLPQSQRDSWDFRRWKEEMDAREPRDRARNENRAAWIDRARLSAFHVGITIERLQELLRQSKLFSSDMIEELNEAAGLELFAGAESVSG